MKVPLHLEYWKDGGWFVGELREIPGVISQGATLDELRENILDAYKVFVAARPKAPKSAKSTKILVPA